MLKVSTNSQMGDPPSPKEKGRRRGSNPWFWIPSLYFAEGLPYVVVMTVAVIMFKRLGISNTDIALYTSWLYLPWVIKPFWSPLVDLVKTKRWWIVVMQLILGACLGGIALAIPLPLFFKATLAFLWLLAFSSATHDIAADGFYLHGLTEHQQTLFVGIRSTFYRIAMITGQGLLIILAGYFETSTGLPPVDLSVKSSQMAPKEVPVPLLPENAVADRNKTYFLTFPQQPEISTQLIAKAEFDSIKKFVSGYNLDNGFVIRENKLPDDKLSWWTRYVSKPLGSFLKQKFNSEKPETKDSLTGNIAVVAVKLSQKPEDGKEMVLNFKFQRGDNSINFLQGERLAFTSKNWDKPAYLLFQADPKLKKPVEALFKGTSGNIHLAWSLTFFILAALFVLFSFSHKFMLPYPVTDKAVRSSKSIAKDFLVTFGSFFKKKDIGVIISFLLLYRFGEAQLLKMASPFMLDPRNIGGMGLTTGEVGLIYGTFGILALTTGGILGGLAAARKGFQYWLWWMVLAINLPHLAYVYMAYAQPDNYLVIGLCVVVEQFSYGFGFTAYMLYMIYISEGKNKTAHFAIATGFMAASMMIPGMFSGWLQEIVGYRNFFVWVMLCMLPGIIPVFFLKVKKDFGIKKASSQSSPEEREQ
jgi:MFS transporter, PAT family, beta-lactamase induction signal transducer AmpG